MNKNTNNLKFLYGMQKLFILVLMFGLFFANTSSAQTNSTSSVPSPINGVIVATVDINKAKIVSQKDRDFVISFDLTNHSGVQPQVKYGIRLIKVLSKGDVLVDQKVYDDTFSISEKQIISKEISYSIPDALSNGTYRLLLESNNGSGLPLATAYIGEVTLKDSEENTVEINSESCSILPTTDTGSKNGPLSVDISIKAQGEIKATCKIISNFTKDVILVPKFILKARSIFGEVVTGISGSKDPILVQPTSENISFELPKAEIPQDYYVEFSLTQGGKVISNTTIFNYSIPGQTGTIQNVVFDKPIYQAGDNAILQIFATASGINKENNITITIQDFDGKECSQAFSKNISQHETVSTTSVLMIKECFNPKANIILSTIGADGKSKMLDSNIFGIEIPFSKKTKPISSFRLGIIIFTIIIFIALFFLYKIKKLTPRVIEILVFLLIAASLFFISTVKTLAATYTYSYDEVSSSIGLLKRSTSIINVNNFYNPGEQMAVTGQAQAGGQCVESGGYYGCKDSNLVISNVKFNGGTGYSLTSASLGENSGYNIFQTAYGNGSLNFTAPMATGTYNLTFNHNAYGNYYFPYSASYGYNITRSLSIPVTVSGPKAFISAASSTIPSGSATTISWSSVNVDSCKVYKDGVNYLPIKAPEITSYTAVYHPEQGYHHWANCNSWGFGCSWLWHKTADAWWQYIPVYTDVVQKYITPGSTSTGALYVPATFDIVCTKGSETVKNSTTVYVSQPPLGSLLPDQIGSCSVRGWACDLGNPASKLSINLFDGLITTYDWKIQIAATQNQWRAIAYGNGLFVSVSLDGKVMTSSDGITWTARTAAAAAVWRSVTYGNGLFVAISNSNVVMTSPDGIAWTQRVGVSGQWRSVTYGNGLFVAVADEGLFKAMTSLDGITWTGRTAPGASWMSVTYANNMFVAVAYNGTNRVMTSPDGITWTARTAPGASWRSVTYGNGLFVAISDGNVVMTSPDGIAWTQRVGVSGQWRSVTYGNGLFVAVSEQGLFKAMTSLDGITWTGRTAPGASWMSVTYANNMFVAVAYNGTNRVMTSPHTSFSPSIITTATASGFSNTLTECGGANHGYSLSIPPGSPLRDGTPHQVTVVAKGVDYFGDLAGPDTSWTRSITCGAASVAISLSATPIFVLKGGSTLINWDSPLASTCEITKIVGADSTVLSTTATSGSITSGILNQNTTFTAQCSNMGVSGQESIDVAVTATPKPKITLFKSEGGLISWETTDATECSLTINGQVIDNLPPSGSYSATDLPIDAEVILNCSNGAESSLFRTTNERESVLSKCILSQTSNEPEDKNLYINRKTTLNVDLNDVNVTSLSRKWYINNIESSSDLIFSKVFTKIGLTTIKAVTTGKHTDSTQTGFNSTCSTSTKFKLDPGIGSGEI